jgi:hypothetical protein
MRTPLPPSQFRLPASFCFFTLAVLLLPGCSLLSGRSSGAERSRPEVRDVSSQARKGNELVPRHRVIVLPFIEARRTEPGGSEQAAKLAREVLIRELRKVDDFVFVAPTDFPKDVSLFLKDGEYDLEAMAKIANAMGIAAIIEGKVVEIKAKKLGDEVGLVRQVRAKIEATVQIRMVGAKTGHLILNETKSAHTEESTTRIAERASSDRYLEEDPELIQSVVTEAFQSTAAHIAQAIEKLSWEGRVAMIKGERVYLNAGRLSGLQIGDILRVNEEGEDVYDPDSGALIGRVPGRLKGTLEVVSYFGKDGAISIVHSGSGFKENDLIELY